ncbi:uncharacterized protein ARMOST_06832 [Armillaria ostoyae]|uniref:Uncharacterized protein n=1 Tax=Armillaria ostoyae TaxID=47428 RepID=A0A284R430_ARMOS|nr:uncharacterized protein ARMOST_06832 [Armillaria ostoyae]
MTSLPPELVETIVHEFWYSDMPSHTRKTFMATCPRINRMWKVVYAAIASRDMYITNLAFLDYLCDIAQFQNSIIYHDFIPQLTRAITCFVDLRANERERAAKEVYCYLTALPNMRGFDTLFPHVPYMSFELAWIGIGRFPPFQFLRGIPIRVRYDRFMSPAFSREHWKTRMDVYVAMEDPDPSAVISDSTWSDMLCKLRNVGVPEIFFGIIVISPGPYEMVVDNGVRHLYQTTHIKEGSIQDWDPRDINKRLWMASKGRHWFRRLVSIFDHWEYKSVQLYLPIPIHSGRIIGYLLEREQLV